ncbi:Hypothetical predicted protein, partial [Paramuricea clavata]
MAFQQDRIHRSCGMERKRFMKRRVVYTANGVSTFNPATFMLTQSGINLINPGPLSAGISCEVFKSTAVPSILPHIDELRLIFKDNSPAVIAITETWLDDSVADSEVEIYGYSLHRLDRCNKRGGGVALYLSDNLKYIRKSELEDGSEALWMQVELNNIRYLIGCVYRAPDESLEVFDDMDDVLSVRLNEFIVENDLEQLIKEPTRVTSNTKSLIDVLITTTPSLFNKAGVLSVTLSDHYPIYGIMAFPGNNLEKHKIITTRSWNENNINNFVNELEQESWSVIDAFDDDDMFFAWEREFKSIFDNCFPRKRIRKQTHPWLDSTLLRVMRKRHQMHKRARKSGSSVDWDEYKRLRNLVTSALRKKRRNYFSNKLNETRGNPKAFWDTLHLVYPGKSQQNVIEKLIVGGKELCDKQDIANSLNEFFTTIANSLLSNQPPPNLQSSNSTVDCSDIFNFKSLNESDVLNALTMINTGKATGADEIPAKALKIAAPYISQVLTKIFNTSYQNGHYPSLWKVARVIPLFKGGCRTERDNQRPISVLPCVSKIHESFVNSDLQEFTWGNGLIKPNQYAYAKNSATTVALIMVVDSWKLAIDKGEK